MPVVFRWVTGLLLLAGGWPGSAVSIAEQAGGDDRSGSEAARLLLNDGSTLHGELASLDPREGLQWRHPYAKDPLQFKLEALKEIRFHKSEARQSLPQSRALFRFVNGDEIFGELIRLDPERITLSTWLGDELEAVRSAVKSITFFPGGYSLVYAGPHGIDGWRRGRRPEAWRFQDGAFVTQGGGTLGRKFDMQGSSSVEFDLKWTGQFSLIVVVQTQVIDRLDYRSGAYKFYFRPGNVNVQRLKAGSRVTNLGQADLPDMLHQDQVRVSIRANKADDSLTLFLDGEEVRRWVDQEGFSAKGSGILFAAQRSGPTIRISNLKVATWSGNFNARRGEQNGDDEADRLYLVNRDEVAGRLDRMRDGELLVRADVADLELAIPTDRVSQIQLAGEHKGQKAPESDEVRLHFWGEGSVSFQLEEWDADRIVGRSEEFGRLEFSPENIHRLEFQPGESQSRKKEPLLDEELRFEREAVMDLDFPDGGE